MQLSVSLGWCLSVFSAHLTSNSFFLRFQPHRCHQTVVLHQEMDPGVDLKFTRHHYCTFCKVHTYTCISVEVHVYIYIYVCKYALWYLLTWCKFLPGAKVAHRNIVPGCSIRALELPRIPLQRKFSKIKFYISTAWWFWYPKYTSSLYFGSFDSNHLELNWIELNWTDITHTARDTTSPVITL